MLFYSFFKIIIIFNIYCVWIAIIHTTATKHYFDGPEAPEHQIIYKIIEVENKCYSFL